MGDREEGVFVEIVGGPKDGTQGIGIPGVTDKIMWRDGSTGRVLVHEFMGMSEDGRAMYRFIGVEPPVAPAPGGQN